MAINRRSFFQTSGATLGLLALGKGKSARVLALAPSTKSSIGGFALVRDGRSLCMIGRQPRSFRLRGGGVHRIRRGGLVRDRLHRPDDLHRILRCDRAPALPLRYDRSTEYPLKSPEWTWEMKLAGYHTEHLDSHQVGFAAFHGGTMGMMKNALEASGIKDVYF